MPLINVKLIEDGFTSEHKTQMIERLTDAMVSIEGDNMRGVTCVTSKKSTAATGHRRQAAQHRRRQGASRRTPA